MFKRNVKSIGDVINHLLRDQGLETPLLQRRVIDAWETRRVFAASMKSPFTKVTAVGPARSSSRTRRCL